MPATPINEGDGTWGLKMSNYSNSYNSTNVKTAHGKITLTPTVPGDNEDAFVTAVIDTSSRWLSLPTAIVEDLENTWTAAITD